MPWLTQRTNRGDGELQQPDAMLLWGDENETRKVWKWKVGGLGMVVMVPPFRICS